MPKFIKEVDEEFICPICTMVLENGVQSQHCEHTYCDACIKEWLTINNICPVDRRELKLEDIKPLPRKLSNILLKSEIKCDFEQSGCPFVTKLEDLETHRKTCKYYLNSKITCDRDCGLEVTQLEYYTHSCIRKLASVVLAQQKQILRLDNEVQYLRNTLLWYSLDGLSIVHNKIEYNKCLGPVKVAIVQYNCQLSETNHYIEIKIIDLGAIGSKRLSSFGLSHCRLRSMDLRQTEIFYSSDGNVLFFGVTVPICVNGDTIGCGIKFSTEEITCKSRGMVYFTHNNKIVWETLLEYVANLGLYPTFVTNSVGSKVIAGIF